MELRVMIVDDEKLERILISKSFEWEEEGFCVVAEADSGDAAMQLVKEHMPDIILTDINMPFMDGLDFSSWVKSYHPTCKIVMITGYREFEYAQRAVKIGVQDFLLKPINKKDIAEVLLKLKADIFKERHQNKEISQLKSAYDTHESILKESFLQRLVAGRTQEEDLKKIELYKLDGLMKGCICINIKIEEEKGVSKEEAMKAREQIQSFILSERFSGCERTVFIHYMGNVIVLCAKEQAEQVRAEGPFYQYVSQIKEAVTKELGISSTIGIGNREIGIEGIAKSYKQSVSALAGSIVYGKNSLICYEDFENLGAQNSEVNKIDLKEFPFCLENNLEEKAFAYIDDYTAFLKKTASLNLRQINMMVASIVGMALNVLEAKGKNFTDVFGEQKEIYSEISKLDTLDEINVFLKEAMHEIMSYLSSLKSRRMNKLIHEAQQVIDENLEDSTLSLKSLAAYLYVNDCYLSRTFKKELGESVIEYITRRRIEKSIEIFNTTDLKAYEVAEKVGINDPHYFGVCFKKYTGKTIKEFKNLG